MSEAICTWPSCGHTAKGQCGLRLVFDPVTRSAVRINPPPDLPPTLSADLIRLRAEVSTLRASEARLREALERADRALKPFADTVFNDNGDCTISDTYLLTDVDFCNAYSARNIARAALQGETK